ncbi:MAG: hypothetical protein RSB82_04480 [Victivallaceae bacterium]
MALHFFNNANNGTPPVVRGNYVNNNSGPELANAAECRAIIVDLDKEISAMESGSLKKAKIIKTILNIAYVAILALSIGLLFTIIFTSIPFWVPLVVSLPAVLLYGVARYRFVKKIVDTELRYKSLVLYREHLRKYSSRLVSAMARYGKKDIVSFQELGFVEELMKKTERLFKDPNKKDSDSWEQIDSRLNLQVPSSSEPFARRYQAEMLVGAENRLMGFWKSLRERVRRAYVDLQEGRSETSVENWKKIAEEALVQDSNISSTKFPVENDTTDLATIKRFCAYSSEALHAVESSMQAFETMFCGYTFLPNSEMALDEVITFRNCVKQHAETLSRYHQWIAEAEEVDVCESQTPVIDESSLGVDEANLFSAPQQIPGDQPLTVREVFDDAREASTEASLPPSLAPVSDAQEAQSAIDEAKRKTRAKNRAEILQSFQAEYPIQATHELLTRVNAFKDILNTKMWSHPERILGVLRSKLEYAESTLSNLNWGTSWLPVSEITSRKQILRAHLEVLKNHILEQENKFREFKDRAQAKSLLENMTAMCRNFEAGQGNLAEPDLAFLEQTKASIISMESLFDAEGNLNAFEQWTDEYRVFCKDFLKLSNEMNLFLDEMMDREGSSFKKACQILLKNPEQAEVERKQTLQEITNLETCDYFNRPFNDLVEETGHLVDSLEIMTGNLRDCLRDSTGTFAIKCQQLNNEYRSFDKQVTAALKAQLRQRAFNIDNSAFDPTLLTQEGEIKEEIERALDEGIHLENVAKRFLSGHVRQTSSIGKDFLSQQKTIIDKLIKAQKKSSQIMSHLSRGLGSIVLIVFIILSILISSLQLWWLPLLLVGISLGTLLGMYGINVLVKRKQYKIAELELSRLMLNDTDDYISPDVDTEESKDLRRLEQTLDLRGMSLASGRNLLESMKKEPLTLDKELTLTEAKKKIKKLKADVDKAIASAPFKLSPYVSVPAGVGTQDVYSTEQKNILAPIIQTIDDCERTMSELDKKLDAAVEEKLNSEKLISHWNKVHTYLRDFEEASPKRDTVLQRLTQKFSRLTWKMDFLRKTLNFKMQHAKPDVEAVQASVEQCIALSKENPSDYEKQMIEIFRKHELDDTVNHLIDCLELKAVKQLDDLRLELKAVKLPARLTDPVYSSEERQRSEEKRERRTEDKKRLKEMGREHLYGYLEYADNHYADLSELRVVLRQLSNMTEEDDSLRCRLLCLKALSLLENIEESWSQLSEKHSFGLTTVTERSEQLIAGAAELRLLGDRVLREQRLGSNAAAKRALNVMKSFRGQRLDRCKKTDGSPYQRVMVGLERYLMTIEQNPSASSVELEEGLIRAMKELPLHVLKEEYLDLNADLAEAKRKKDDIQRRMTLFTQVKNEFYVQEGPKEKKLFGRKKAPQEVIDPERRKLIELQNLQLALLEAKRKIAILNTEMRAVKDRHTNASHAYRETIAGFNLIEEQSEEDSNEES